MSNTYLDAITAKTYVEAPDYIPNARQELALTMRIAQLDPQSAPTPNQAPVARDVAGSILGAMLGLLYGILYVVIAAYTMPSDPGPENGISTQTLALIIVAAGTVIAALLSGLMAARAAALQRRGKELAVISVR